MPTVKAPGKLYIAGEYAVVEPGQPAILIAVDQFVYATISQAKQGLVSSKQLLGQDIYWTRENDQLQTTQATAKFAYVLKAIELTERYAKEQNCQLSTFNLQLDSDLDSPDGKKYGLGSSAAVTVATVKAVAAYYNLALTPLEIFKLAASAHYLVQKNGSLGDIAASSFGGWIAYHSFDRSWLLQGLQDHSMTELLKLTWPKLQIESLEAPPRLQLLIGWTGSPASTSNLINEVALSKEERQRKYDHFLEQSALCVSKMIAAFKQQDLEVIMCQLARDRELLRSLETFSQVTIETPKLHQLITLAQKFGGQAKTSGAGGGDCGIAILAKEQPLNELLNAWKQAGITPLSFSIYHTTLERS